MDDCIIFQASDCSERFSRKVFVGGLPPDIDEGKYIKLKVYMVLDMTNLKVTRGFSSFDIMLLHLKL